MLLMQGWVNVEQLQQPSQEVDGGFFHEKLARFDRRAELLMGGICSLG